MSADTVKYSVQTRDNLFVIASLGKDDKLGSDADGRFVIYKPSEMPLVGPLITRSVRYMYGESIDKTEALILDLYKVATEHVDSLFAHLELRQVEVISRASLLRVEYNAINARLTEVKGWMADITKAQQGLKFQVDMYAARPKLVRLHASVKEYICDKDELVHRLSQKLESFQVEEIDGTKKPLTKVITTRIEGANITTEVTTKEEALHVVPLKAAKSSDSTECRQSQKKVIATDKKINQ